MNLEIRVGYKTAAFFAANPNIVLEAGQLCFVGDGANIGKYKIGDGTTQLSALTFYGGVSTSGLTIGTTAITGGTDTRVLYNNNGVVGEYTTTGTGTTLVKNASPTFTGKVEIGVGATGISTNFSNLRVGVNNGLIDFGSIATNFSTIWMGKTTPSASNYTILANSNGSAITIQGESTVALSYNQGTQSFILSSTAVTLSDTLNIAVGSTTGTKIGTATTQKIGFWNSTPVVKQTVTGSRGGNAALADLLTKLATIGILTNSTTA